MDNMAVAGLRSAEASRKHILQVLSSTESSCFVLLDEIQLVANWEEAINSLRLDVRFDIVITGSNANLLASELSTCQDYRGFIGQEGELMMGIAEKIRHIHVRKIYLHG